MLRRSLPAFALLLALTVPAFAAKTTSTVVVSPAPEQTFMQLEVMAEQDSPGACLVFTGSIDEAQRDTLSSLVTVAPPENIAIKLNDNRICLEGLTFGTSYKVSVKPGLSGNGLAPSSLGVEQTVEVPNRTPALAFRSGGYVLPRLGAEGIPVRSVNVSKARITIYRINDRNLIGQIGNGIIGAQMAGYQLIDIENMNGEKVYTGTLTIARNSNQWTNTLIPVQEALKDRKPGIYIATAENADETAPKPEYWSDKATQWFVISDLGLSAFRSPTDGLAVVARSLGNAAVKPDITLTLVAQNNSELGTATTGRDGIARFAPGLLRGELGNSPRAVYALDKATGDFSFVDIGGAALDLTDRGVAGRYASGPMDAYMVTERGIYRPGETVYATALLRDAQLKAITGLPLTLKVIRPDGKEAATRTVNEVADGGYSFTYDSNVSDQGGTWSLQLYTDIKLPPVGSVSFQLEDFQPPRLEIEVKPQTTAIGPDATGVIDLEGRFLYGAPAGGLKGQAVITLKYAAVPFAQYADYQFGQIEEKFLPVRAELPEYVTDEAGKARLELALGALPDSTHPLEASLNVTLFDVGGRPVSEDLSLPVHNIPAAIGLRPTASSFAENAEAGFDVVVIDTATGTPKAASGLTWNLYSEEYDYMWFRAGNSWNYETTIRSSRVGNGKLDVTEAEPRRLNVSVQSGYYRLEVRDDSNKLVSSVRFNAGWRANPAALDKPDAVSVTRNTSNLVKPGERVAFNIKPPYDAEATLVVADTRLRSVATQKLAASGTDVTLTVPDDAAGGFYVLVSAVQNKTANANTPPRRAMGVLWVPLDPAQHELALNMTAPELARPGTTVNVELTAAGMGSQNVHVVLAAVDDGVLGMTDYKSPNPSAWYLGQRWLNLSSYDIYASLIDSSNAARGEMREGGDGSLNRQLKGLPQQTTKIAALYSGIVSMQNGKATIPLALPDFNGRLRLMAFAYTATRTGQSEAMMTVRAPLVAELMLPRFMAPGDVAQVSLEVDNRDAPKGDYAVKLTASGPVTLEGGESALALDAGQRKNIPLRLTGNGVGEAAFNLEITGPENFSLTRSFNISVRSGNPTITRRLVSMLTKGSEYTVKPDLLTGLLSGTEEMTVAYSALPEFDVPNLLQHLNRYPYGCAEQTTSTAMPLLYANRVASSLGMGQDAALRGRIQAAIVKLTAMQRKDGGFGIWSASDSYEIWLTSYIADFLSRAKTEGYVVTDSVLQGLYERLRLTLKDSYVTERDIASRAYVLYILARNNSVDAADVRYFYDTWFNKLPSRLARTQIAAALKLVGDEARSEAALGRIDTPRVWQSNYAYDYGSDLRDDAAVITLMGEHKLAATPQLLTMSETLARVRAERYWMSTQESAWLLLAANAMMATGPAEMHLTVGSDAVNQKEAYYRNIGINNGPLVVKNNGERDVFQVITMSGVPLDPQPAEVNGFALSRSYYRPDGTPTQLKDIRQNDLIVVMVDVTAQSTLAQQVILADMLPAGFELENTRLYGNSGALGNLAWLGDSLTIPENVEFRADRYVAAVNMGEYYYSRQQFRIAYIMRAVTPGTFAVPGSYVEDMYIPSRFARTEAGMVTISAAQ